MINNLLKEVKTKTCWQIFCIIFWLISLCGFVIGVILAIRCHELIPMFVFLIAMRICVEIMEL